ncbi:MAG TPA: glycoside hydrolase family 15 protein, partial [Minicystis sp.]|nr:glycoside hydrolase family 15 protein [Minicystis sp.]
GRSGAVELKAELVLRFDYGHVVPWVRTIDGRLNAVAGPDGVVLASPVRSVGRGKTSVAEFDVSPGDRVPFVLTWYPSHERPPENAEPFGAIDDTASYWRKWARCASCPGPYRDLVVRSLITLKALTYAPTGAIVAAGTASIPESLGGERNWDYRYSWLRDATFTLYAMMHAGYREEAAAWRDWLLRAIAGEPSALQIMYGIAGERRLDEWTPDWLPGYEGSRPVRVGNAAAGQLQLDVYGEVMDAFHQARRMGIHPEPEAWSVERVLLEWLESNWARPDEGLWEIRADRQRFTHSKVMAWAAFDRAVKTVERQGLEGPVDRWRKLRDEIHADVCKNAFSRAKNAFTQAYGSELLDASALLMPIVGFLPPSDPRMLGTIAAIERELVVDGFVQRYATGHGVSVDGLRGKEGAFLACSFWLVDAYVLAGRKTDARALFERLSSVANDVGLLSEEYDVRDRRLVGNFPQAFSHVALVNAARSLSEEQGAAEHRSTSLP